MCSILRSQDHDRGLMHQYSVRTPFKKIAEDITEPILESKKGNRYLLIAMYYFTKWPEVCAIQNQEASTVTDALVHNYFCCFRVPRAAQ
jgi:hypothetical protein